MIELEYFERPDFNQLIRWIDSPEFLLQWGGPQFDYPLNENQLEKYIENANRDTSDTLIYKVIHKETGNVIGHVSLRKIDRKNKSARIGKVLVGEKNLTSLRKKSPTSKREGAEAPVKVGDEFRLGVA